MKDKNYLRGTTVCAGPFFIEDFFGATMHGKNPTKKQRMFLKSKKLNDENWLVCKDTPQEMIIKHRKTDKYKTIKKAKE